MEFKAIVLMPAVYLLAMLLCGAMGIEGPYANFVFMFLGYMNCKLAYSEYINNKEE